MISDFRGSYHFLSNFYPCSFSVDGFTYTSVEAYFQSQKTLNIGQRQMIAKLNNPALARKMGKRVDLREDWNEVKDNIMYQGVHAKFIQDANLREKLIKTSPEELVEGNTWGDKYWGVCKGEGQNKLGKILMQVRDECIKFEEVYNCE